MSYQTENPYLSRTKGYCRRTEKVAMTFRSRTEIEPNTYRITEILPGIYRKQRIIRSPVLTTFIDVTAEGEAAGV